VVANGAEGEPASAKDRVLLQQAPHLVLDGLQLAAECVGSVDAYVYVHEGPAADSIGRALSERRTRDIDRIPVNVVVADDRFVAGEESAVVSRIEGHKALPRDKAELVVHRGIHGRPTLVQNVETLAHLALVARHGALWFRERGTADELGTFLATIGGAVRRPGVLEAEYGIGLMQLLTDAGGESQPLQAVLIGGYHGAWLPVDVIADVVMSRAGLQPFGATPGAGVVVALPDSACGLVATAEIARYLAGQNTGQCGPCFNGLPAIASILGRLASGEASRNLLTDVDRLARLVEGRGACHHPDGAVRFVRSGLRVFADEVRLHRNGRCRAHVSADAL